MATTATTTTTTPKGLLPPGVSSTPSPYHMTFRLMKDQTELRRFTFLINPQQYSVKKPTNNTILQTLDGGFAQAFGRGLAQITIQGTTGSQTHITRSNVAMSGLEALQYLNTHIFDEYTDRQFMDPAHVYTLRFYNWSLDQYYSIIWQQGGLQLQQDVTHPIWWFYNMSFTVLDILPAPVHFKQKKLGSVLLQSLPSGVTTAATGGGSAVTASTDSITSTFSTNAVSTALNLRNQLAITSAQLMGMISGNNLGGLSQSELDILSGYPVPFIPNESLTSAQFPNYQQYTGSTMGVVNPPTTVVGLVKTTITPVLAAIGQASAGKVPYSYSNIVQALAAWRTMRTTISAAFNPPPTELLWLIGQVIQAFSGLAALQSVYTATPAGVTVPL